MTRAARQVAFLFGLADSESLLSGKRLGNGWMGSSKPGSCFLSSYYATCPPGVRGNHPSWEREEEEARKKEVENVEWSRGFQRFSASGRVGSQGRFG